MIPAYVKANPVPYLIGAGVLVVVAYIALRGVKGVATDLGGVAGDAVTGVAMGLAYAPLKSTAQFFGMPENDLAKCKQAKLTGQTTDAAKYCAAGDFAAYLWSGK